MILFKMISKSENDEAQLANYETSVKHPESSESVKVIYRKDSELKTNIFSLKYYG